MGYAHYQAMHTIASKRDRQALPLAMALAETSHSEGYAGLSPYWEGYDWFDLMPLARELLAMRREYIIRLWCAAGVDPPADEVDELPLPKKVFADVLSTLVSALSRNGKTEVAADGGLASEAL